MSGGIYHGDDGLVEIQGRAFTMFALSNPLHPDVFPGIRRMESEVVSWVSSMFKGGPDACGVMTSGGTGERAFCVLRWILTDQFDAESILMACKAYRERAFEERGVTEPEMYGTSARGVLGM